MHNFDNLQDCDLDDLNIDYRAGAISCRFRIPGGEYRNFRFRGLFSVNYLTDFSDEPPWICLEFSVEEINSYSDLDSYQKHWVEGSPILSEIQYPIYKCRMASGDFSLDIICNEVDELPGSAEAGESGEV